MGNTTNVNQKVHTPMTKDVACQVEILTRKGIKRSYNETYIVEETGKKHANRYPKCNIEMDNKKVFLESYDKPTSENALICVKCTMILDQVQDNKVVLEPCKHLLCVQCYCTIYWKGEHFLLSSAILQTCYKCNAQLSHISTDTNCGRDIRYSLCNLNDYVTFHHKDKVLHFTSLPQISLPYHFILSSKYFPLDTPQSVQNDIRTYISQQLCLN